MNRSLGKWTLPQPTDMKEEEEWVAIPKIARTVPFGYVVDENDTDYQFNILEMHVHLDIEEYLGPQTDEKNVKIPYIVTIDEGSQEVLAIYRNYDMNDALMKRKEYLKKS